MLKFKDGVPLEGLQPDMLYCLDICNDVFKAHGFDCVVTSTTDGKHMIGSFHYIGYAVDLRTRHLDEHIVDEITGRLMAVLGDTFDVVLESDHIHIEFQQ